MAKARVVGAGLAGAEAINYLAHHGFEIEVYELKPARRTPAHHSDYFGELVCSNSLKSESPTNACGLLKEELQTLGSLVMEAAYDSRLPSGQDLAVDRDCFAEHITQKLKSFSNVEFKNIPYESIEEDGIPTIIATGPLTSTPLLAELQRYLGEKTLSFFDAAAPLVFGSSLDLSKLFSRSRYDKGEGRYLNSPLSLAEYRTFCEALIGATRVELHDFEHFEGCLPLEVMATRGFDTLRYGPLKPAGLTAGLNPEPHAVVQLRQDDAAANLYGLVGFQTNLTAAEQRRVFSLIPGLENVKFARFGLMHQNAYLNSPRVLTRSLNLKKNPNIFIAGQLSGVEGYVESAATGLLAGIYLAMLEERKDIDPIPLGTMMGSLVNYLVMSSPKHFQPMNATYGILQDRGRKSKEECESHSLGELERWRMKNKI